MMMVVFCVQIAEHPQVAMENNYRHCKDFLTPLRGLATVAKQVKTAEMTSKL